MASGAPPTPWLQRLGLRRSSHWDSPTFLDYMIEAPLNLAAICLYRFFNWIRQNPFSRRHGPRPIKVVCISDTHDLIPQNVPDGDLLIHAGDTTNNGSCESIQAQIDWMSSLPHPHKVLVCGNHDSWFDHRSRQRADHDSQRPLNFRDVRYLENTSLTLEFRNGRSLKIFGAPGVPQCGGPENAFQYSRDDPGWAGKIPVGTDILITHTPPRFHMDLNLGCEGLLQEVWGKKPRLHVFGHIHCGRGQEVVFWDRCQGAYEAFMARKNRSVNLTETPGRDRRDIWKIWRLGWESIWEGWWKSPDLFSGTSLMVNAAVQDGNSGKLSRKTPISVWI